MTTQQPAGDGVHAMVPREKMTPSARKIRDAYARVPDAPLFRMEFGYYSLERWKEQKMPTDDDLAELEFVQDTAGRAVLYFPDRRDGFVPTCDHGVPEEVPYANYLHYRRRCVELGG